MIKVDGQALTDHTGYGPPILIDPTMIERNEIVRGASSVVSGSRAIGGVVNIITKRGGDKAFEGSVSAGYFSATDGYRTSVNLGGRQGNFDYRLSFGKSDMGDRDAPSGPLVPSDIQDQNTSLHLGYTSGNHYWFLKAQKYDLSANAYTGSPVISVALPKRDLTKLGLYYEGTDVTPWISKLNFNLFNQTVDREFVNVIRPGGPVVITSSSEDEQTTYGFNLDATLEFAQGHRTLIGLQYENDFIDSNKTTVVIASGPPAPPTLRNNDARIETFSLYAQHEMELSNTLTGTVGARFYKVDAALEASNVSSLSTNSDTRWLGSAGLVWTPKEELALRVNLSQGYSYPTLQQMFMTTSAAGRLTTGNPNLKPENSTSLELGARFDNGNSVVDATMFYTEAKDYISTAPNPAPPNYTYVNVNGATSYGLEIYAEKTIGDSRFTPYISATRMRRKFEYGTGVSTYDSGTPEIFGKVGVRYDWDIGNIFGTLDAFVQGEGKTVTRNSAGAIIDQTGGYATFNIAAEAELAKNLHLTASFNNLFDKGYDPVNGIEGAERNFNLFMTYKF
ncbi:TonB-dependent receptor [Profundibacter sp.]